MVKATCGSCGTLHELDDAEVPPSGKVMKCRSCGKPVTVMHASATEMGFPSPPPPPGAGGTGDTIDLGGALDGADPNAIKRRSPLAGAKSVPGQKAPPSGLAAAKRTVAGQPLPPSPFGGVSPPSKIPPIPMPKNPRAGQGGNAPRGLQTPGDEIELGASGDALEIGDLPAPVNPAASLGGSIDLPAPVGPTPTGGIDLPAPVGPTPSEVVDLPAPVGPGRHDAVDLPAPVGPTSTRGRAAPGPGVSDLPAPVGPASTKGRLGGGGVDLPAPVGPTATKGGLGGGVDLPAPVGPASTKAGLGPGNLPAPVGPTATKAGLGDGNLPAPVGPTSSKQGDLPAPKGFFDDVPAPSGAFDLGAPLPAGDSLPAPKGFFDDVPAPSGAFDLGTPRPAAGNDGLPAPKGFFDDVPAPSGAFDLGAPTAKSGNAEAPAPKGFFDDIPAPSTGTADTLAGSALGRNSLDLDDLDLAPPSKSQPLDLGGGTGAAPGAATLHLGDAASPGSGATLDIGADPSGEPEALDLGGAAAPLDLGGGGGPAPLDLGGGGGPAPLDLGGGSPGLDLPGDDGLGFGNVDLPSIGGPPTGGPPVGGPPSSPGGVSFAPTSTPAPEPKLDIRRPADDGLGLDIKKPAESTKKARGTVAELPSADDDKGKKGKTKGKGLGRTQKLIAVGAVLLLAIGGGGYYFLQQQSGKKKSKKEVGGVLKRAKAQLRSDKPGHWQSAASFANRALKMDKGNADALGIGVQAQYAAYLDTGHKKSQRSNLANALLRRATKANATGIELDKGEALGNIVSGTPAQVKEAIQMLTKVLQRARGDQDAQLYLGWAHMAARDYANAVKAFDGTLQKNPNRVPALYGKGQAYAALGKNKEAREAFAKVIERNPNHVGAQVGNAQLLDLPLISDREARYMEILARKDIDKADPRAVSLAWSLAADQALLAGRLDEAKQRYDRAANLDPANVSAVVGKAKAALRQNRLDSAREKLEQVLTMAPGHLDAALSLAEVEVKAGKLEEAQKQLDAITKGSEAQSKPDKARIHMVQGQIHETTQDRSKGSKNYDSAIAEYKAASELLGEGPVAPVLSMARVYRKAGKKKDAIQILKALSAKARGDAALSLTLGLTYMANADAASAETWFRRAIELKPGDVEATFQLGLALHAQKKSKEALATLEKAYDSDQAREDIGTKLAIILEGLGQDQKAADLYEKLLKSAKPTVNVMARAGRFLVRMKRYDRIGQLYKDILATNKNHPAGLFLRGEHLFQQKKYQESVRYYRDAVKNDPAPQFLDGLARAYENLKPPAYEDALGAYTRAANAAPSMVSPRLGIARIYLARNLLPQALGALEDARKVDPKNAWVYFKTGVVYQERSEQSGGRSRRALKKAIKEYRLAVRYDSKHGEAYYRLGRAYYDYGNREGDAARSLAKASAIGDAMNPQPPWLTEAFRLWGYAERSRDNRRGAINAFEKYLARDPSDRAEAAEVRRLLIGLKSR